MKDLAIKFSALICCLLVSGAGTASADEAAALREEMANLNRQISTLEAKFAGLQQSGSVPTYVATSAGEEKAGLLSDIQVGGYVETQYNQNLTRGGNAIAGGNNGRIFDTDRESFSVNAVEVNFAKEANPEGGAGFRFDVQMGEDAQVVNGDGAAGDKFDLQQAYVEYNQSLAFLGETDLISDTINFKAGRFTTLAGAEVIEGPDNWNISRSYAFGLALPFVHTGVRSNFQVLNDFFDVYFGVNNGWDNAVDNNTGKTFEFGLGYSPIEKVSVFHALYFGNENNPDVLTAGDNGSNAGGSRFLLSNVVSYDVTEKLSLKGEFNVGQQRRAVASGENVQWYTYNAYARYQLTDKWAAAYRFELFRDQEQFRTGLDRTLWGQTLTLERQVAENLIGRLEYRLDRTDNNDAFGEDSNMSTIGAQLIYLI
ncbi:MAG: porin [Candidatus Omnitrophica bacterium]|nr:porin [Candidatus Omnitrophota bacterium]